MAQKNEEKRYVVYVATNTVNGKQYVGQSMNFNNRLRYHKWAASHEIHEQSIFYNAIKKYGWNQFSWEILGEYNSIDDLNQAEIDFISSMKTLSPGGYNLQAGGDNYEVSEEIRQRMSERMKGSKNPNYGKVRSESHCKALSEALKGNQNTGVGENNHFYGKKHDDETRKIMSEKARGENSINAHTNWEAVRDIRESFANGTATIAELAAKHGISRSNASAIKNNKAWIDKDYNPPPFKPRKVLTDEEIVEVYNLAHEGILPIPEIAKRFQSNKSKITQIKFKRCRPDLLNHL